MFEHEYTPADGPMTWTGSRAERPSRQRLSARMMTFSAFPATEMRGIATISRPMMFGSKRTSLPRLT